MANDFIISARERWKPHLNHFIGLSPFGKTHSIVWIHKRGKAGGIIANFAVDWRES